MKGCIAVNDETTRDELIAQGVTPEGADELLQLREQLRRKHAPTPEQPTP